ncbi:MAG: hypothetical protein ACRDMV_22855 [Streptosporangiales bacterium]
MGNRVLEAVRIERFAEAGTGRTRTVAGLRAITAAALLLSADVHLVLYLGGFGQIAVIGPLFLVNVVAGLALALGVLLIRHPLVLLGAAGFGVATFGAYLLSATVGLFRLHETTWDTQAVLAAVAEIVVIVGAVLVWVAERTGRHDDRA